MIRKCLLILVVLAVALASAPSDAAKRHKPSKASEYYQKGCSYESFGILDKAEESYRLAVKEDPKFNAAIFRLACLLDLKGSFKESGDLYKKVIDSDKTFYPAYNNYAIAEYRQGRKDVAVKYWIQSLKINPAQADVFNNLGLAASSDGDYRKAVEFYDRALKIKPLYSGAAKNRAFALFMAGDYAAADAQLAKNSRVFSADPFSYYNYAVFCIDWRNYRKAVKMLEMAVKEKSNVPAFFESYAVALAYCREFGDARAKLASSLELGGETFSYYKAAGKVEQIAKSYDKALASYLKAMKKNDSDEELMADLGTLYSSMKLDNQALNTWEIGIARKPSSALIRNARAAHRIARGDYSSALVDVEAVLAKNPSDFNALYLKGVYEQNCGHSGKAIECFDLANDACPYFFECDICLAELYSSMGDRKKATEILSDSIEKNPQEPALFCALGKTFYDMGNHETAVKTWMDGLAIDGSYGLIYYYMAASYEEAGDMDEARRCYSTYLRLDPDGKYAETAKRKIMGV